MVRALLVFGLVCSAGAAFGQDVARLSDLNPARISYGGRAELFTEKVWVRGRERRRPPETVRLLMRPYLRFGSDFELAANVLVSTEGSGFGSSGRQNINHIGISPSWSWGSAALGDFYRDFTPLTFRGVPVRGAALDLEPGWLRFAALGGRTSRAVSGDAVDGSYERRIYAGRLGIGRGASSYLDLIAVYADDDANSLPADTSYVEPDTTGVGTVVGTSGATPQQNLVLAMASQVSLWRRQLLWKGEFAASAFTRDKRAAALAEDSVRDIPAWLTRLMPPRIGSNIDLAYDTSLQLRLPTWNLLGGYRLVGPGYRSLGVGSLLVDRRELRGRAAWHTRRLNAALAGSRQNDNILDQKEATTHRNTLAGTFGVRPADHVALILRGSRYAMSRDTPDPADRIDYRNHAWGLAARVTLRRDLPRSLGLDYRLQWADEGNPARGGTRFRSHQLVVPVGFQLGEGLQLTPQVGIVRIRTGDGAWRLTHTELLALRHVSAGRKWTNTLSVGNAINEGSRRLTVSAVSSCRLADRTRLKLVLRNNVYRVRGAGTGDWEELVARAILEREW